MKRNTSFCLETAFERRYSGQIMSFATETS